MIDWLAKPAKYMPEIKKPDKPLSIKEKMFWTGAILLLFFFMYNTTALGVVEHAGGSFTTFLQVITASKIGSLLTVGIEPIVLASIFLQLLSSGGFFEIDLQDPEERVKFHEAQKTLTVLLSIFIAFLFVGGGRVVLVSNNPFLFWLVVLQITLGAIVLFYADEIVTKYGIGSGVSLFIAAGVSYAVFFGLIGLIFGPQGAVAKLLGGGATAIPDALLTLLPFGFTILVFLAVAYAEGTRVEIPLSHEFGRSIVKQQGFKFFYVSNIPVIFAASMLMAMAVLGISLGHIKTHIIVGGHDLMDYIAYTGGSGRVVDGLFYYFSPVYYGYDTVQHFRLMLTTTTPLFHIPEWVHAIGYTLFMVVASIFFGTFWAETQGMDAKSVAEQLASARLQIPGYRRDPRLLERVLKRYIDPLVFVSSAAVGLLAACADLLGALGTGTGILLTVGIFYNLYEQMESMHVFDIYPKIAAWFE